MTPKVSIIMGSTSDLKIMESAAQFFDEMEIPYEINALSAHRVPCLLSVFRSNLPIQSMAGTVFCPFCRCLQGFQLQPWRWTVPAMVRF